MVNKNPLSSFDPIDMSLFLRKEIGYETECKKLVQYLHDYGIVIVRNPKVGINQNSDFMKMMEEYFSKPNEIKMKDSFPKYFFQIGSTPNHTEKAVPHCKEIATFDKENMPVTLCPPEFDPKWRFFWPIGPNPEKTEFKRLNAAPVVPKDFPQWQEVMNSWGQMMLDTSNIIARMAAVGFGLPEETFVDLMKFAPHLLAPTGSNLDKYHEKNDIFAHLHQDLNFITVHGKSNYPGLYVWLRNKKKALVSVPDHCFLAQAGMQFEYLTGGKVLAGFHEVVVCDETVELYKKRKAQGGPLWRVSTTFFAHIASDQYLEPLPSFQKNEALYPKIKAGNQVLNELKKIFGEKKD